MQKLLNGWENALRNKTRNTHFEIDVVFSLISSVYVLLDKYSNYVFFALYRGRKLNPTIKSKELISIPAF